MLKYIELKSGYSDNGPAWIARVTLSRSGRTVYVNGKALKRASAGMISGNHFDLETGEEYWVSGIKRDGLDRCFNPAWTSVPLDRTLRESCARGCFRAVEHSLKQTVGTV